MHVLETPQKSCGIAVVALRYQMASCGKDDAAYGITWCLYQVKNREGKKAIWTRIGSAWAHSDGAGFNIQLDAYPIDGKITLRVPAEKEE